MAYIPNADVSTDMLASQFTSSFSTYHTLVDNHINELADGEQVETSDIATDDDGYVENKFLRRYCKYWFCMMLFLDKMGINDTSLADEEKYKVKYDQYKELVNDMKNRITVEVLTNEIASRMSKSETRNLYRG